MTTKLITIDRRRHPRDGVFAEIENVTYALLRKHGINGQLDEAPARGTGKAA